MRKPFRRSRRSQVHGGFTVIELLVVMAITGILVSLVMAGVMSARESARRMDCLSRLSQCGKALHGYEATHGNFPSARINSDPTKGVWDQASPQSRLLPFVDQAALYARIDFTRITFHVPPYPPDIATQVVAVYNCPSDPAQSGCNYRVCTGGTPYWYTSLQVSPLGPSAANGAFTGFEVHSAGDFTDGLSHTIAMSEKIKGLGQQWSRGAFWYTGLAAIAGTFHDTQTIVDTCASLTSVPAVFGGHAGQTWLTGCYDFTWYNHALPPNARITDCSIHSVGSVPHFHADHGAFGARSYHSGGVNSVFMDGSGRFVSNSIDLGIWRAAATRAGNEADHDF